MTDQPLLVPSIVREDLPDPEAVGEDAELVERLRAEIAERGPITFARFMERALYEPDHGYYRRPETGPGRAGADFLTAPEAHPIFGAAIGLLVAEAWTALGSPTPFRVLESGAGTGALAAGLLAGLRDTGSALLDAVRYVPDEVEGARLPALRARLEAAGLAAWLDEISDATSADPTGSHGPADPPPWTGAVIANEVLDALPVHRVVGRPRAPGGLRELLVGAAEDGRFVHVEAEPTTPALAAALASEGVQLADGEVTETCLAIDAWLARVTAGLERGLVVLVDYAAEPADLHGAARPTGTLRTFARHAVGGDPFRHVGRQDLTATVDLAAVRSAAVRCGLMPVGETTQAELLARAGTSALTDTYLRRPGAGLEDALALRSALARLLDPRGMGAFRVLVLGRGLPSGTGLSLLERVRPR